MNNTAYYTSKIGILKISYTNTSITHLQFADIDTDLNLSVPSELSNRAIEQVREFLDKKRKYFDLPIQMQGTDFQCKVWKALREIPFGETRSYKQIAERIGNPKAVRAVGMANNKNPIAIIVPCHRVIGSNGKLVGYAGGLQIKQMLLNIEKNSFL